MNIVTFDEVRDDIIKHFKKNSLIPFIGSGFSMGCKSKNGTVPSGAEYKEIMIDKICELDGITYQMKQELCEKSFSDISTFYHKMISDEFQRKILRDLFSEVICDENKIDFLNINWPYIYTLNIDDAIEKTAISIMY